LQGANTGVTVAGGNGQGSAANQLNHPFGVLVVGSNLYINDADNHRVQRISNGPTGNSYTPTQPGTYSAIVTTNGCTATTNTITITNLPTATISGSTTVCANASSPSITFTGATTVPPFTFTYTINGVAQQTVTTSSGNSVTVPVSTTTAGTYVYTLISVRDGNLVTNTDIGNPTATVVVNQPPTASIVGTTEVCKNAASPLVTFNGGSSTAPYTFTYTINGGSQQTVTTSSGNSVSVQAPTGNAGTYVYSLITVKDASSLTCTSNASGTATITVNPLPTASISGTTAVCQNAISPSVTFVGSNASAPYTFAYAINGGTPQTITTTSGNTVTVSAPTNTVGSFVYSVNFSNRW